VDDRAALVEHRADHAAHRLVGHQQQHVEPDQHARVDGALGERPLVPLGAR
jgi:hypothetical protein